MELRIKLILYVMVAGIFRFRISWLQKKKILSTKKKIISIFVYNVTDPLNQTILVKDRLEPL